jgi:nitrite reductase/ring-hydroxylating ferredoxin subunit
MNVEIDGTDIMIANVENKFYAVSDRCPRMSALLSKSALDHKIVTCLAIFQPSCLRRLLCF